MKAFTLIEIIVYIAILGALIVVAVNTILTIHSSLGAIRLTRLYSSTEALAMERTIRVIRDAQSVDVAASTFDVSPGVLSLVGSEDPAVTRLLSLSGGALQLKDGAAPDQALTPPGVVVTSLIFRHITGGSVSEAVKVEMTLSASSGRATTTQKVYGTAVLRNSYQ